MKDVESLPKELRNVFEELIKQDPELSQRIREQLKVTREEKLKKRKERLFGYDVVDGKLVINQEESKIVKWIFDHFLSYSENPPEELVKIAVKRAKSRGIPVQDISFEEAKSLVTGQLVKEYMSNELSLKDLYYQAISEKDPTIRFEDILPLPMEELPKNGLEKLMSDISQLDIMRKQQEHSLRLNHILTSDLYNDTTRLTARPANKKDKIPQKLSLTLNNNFEPIISPEMFQAAQEKLNSHHKKAKADLSR